MAFPLPDRPSIAVLPFDNLSGNTDQDYLADGLTEEIITTLSKSPNLFVIARNSTFTYKDKAVEVKQVAEEQGVRYVLEGSIQRSGVRIRVNIQLIDALVGRHVWAEIYDRQFGDIFALQDDITQNILIALEVELTQGEEVRLMHLRAPKPEAFVYLQKSRAHYYRFNSKDNAIARELAMKAVEISPEYPDAWEWLGWYDFNDYRFAWSADPNKSFKLAEEAANKAFVLDATVAGANGLLGALSLYRGEYEEAISHYRKAVELAPSNAIMTAGLGWVLCYGGYPEEAIPVLQQAMRLSPYYPAWMVGTLGLAFMMTGDYPKAIVATEQLIERKSLLQFGYSRLAAIHAALGDDEKAKTYAAELLKIKPDFSIAKWSKVLIYKDKELLDWELNALRSAGLPE
jgi:TolB-like protein/Tfp pilus assembly protein PilF